MSGEKILVVDDEAAATRLIAAWLEEAGYQVITARDGLEGLQLFYQHHPELVVLDVLMPKMDGLTLCQRIREVSKIPLLMLSAVGREADVVRALELGADDYVTKPARGKELLARVRAALRRATTPYPYEDKGSYSDGVLSIDFLRHEVQVGGQPASLTRLEYELLTRLVQHAGQVLTHDQLLDLVWGPEYDSVESVKWHIARLRRKVEEDPQRPRRILSVRGVGYRYDKPAPLVS